MIKESELIPLFEEKGISLEKYKRELFDGEIEIETPFCIYTTSPIQFGADGGCFYRLSKIKIEILSDTVQDPVLEEIRDLLVKQQLFFSENTEFYEELMLFSTIMEFTVNDG